MGFLSSPARKPTPLPSFFDRRWVCVDGMLVGGRLRGRLSAAAARLTELAGKRTRIPAVVFSGNAFLFVDNRDGLRREAGALESSHGSVSLCLCTSLI